MAFSVHHGPSDGTVEFVLAGDPQIGFGPDGEQADTRRLVQLARQVNSLRPAVVFLAGDLTDAGTDRQWRQFNQALAEFQVPVRLVMGNHDYCLPAAPGRPEPLHQAAQTVGEALDRFRGRYGKDYYSFRRGLCRFVVLNATVLICENQSLEMLGHASRQWAWLERTLRAAAREGSRTFLVMHQPPFVEHPAELGVPLSEWRLPARQRLLELARSHGVKDVLCGHLHRNIRARGAGLTVHTVAGTSAAWDELSHGFCVFRVRGDRMERRFVPLKA